VPLDATHKALVSRADVERLDALGTPAGDAAARFIGRRRPHRDGHTHPRAGPAQLPGCVRCGRVPVRRAAPANAWVEKRPRLQRALV
jgi:hypothetical protein